MIYENICEHNYYQSITSSNRAEVLNKDFIIITDYWIDIKRDQLILPLSHDGLDVFGSLFVKITYHQLVVTRALTNAVISIVTTTHNFSLSIQFLVS